MAVYWKGMTAEQLLIKREIDRINRQIREAARQFGKDSRLYQQYATLLTPLNQESFNRDLVRENKSGIPQISLAKKSILELQSDVIMQRRLNLLSKQQTVQQAKQAYITAYQEKHNIDKPIRGRAERAAVFAEMVAAEKQLFNDVSNGLLEYYKYYKKGTLSSLSKGYWSSEQDLDNMLKAIKKGLDNEKKQIIKNAFEGY